MPLAIVLNQRQPHTTKAGQLISKLPIRVDGKNAFIYCQVAIGDGTTVFDDLKPNQTINVEKQGQFYKLSENQEVSSMSTSEAIFDQFEGSKVLNPQECKKLDELQATELLSRCILEMRKRLPQEFNSEDCRCAGISLFIQLCK